MGKDTEDLAKKISPDEYFEWLEKKNEQGRNRAAKFFRLMGWLTHITWMHYYIPKKVNENGKEYEYNECIVCGHRAGKHTEYWEITKWLLGCFGIIGLFIIAFVIGLWFPMGKMILGEFGIYLIVAHAISGLLKIIVPMMEEDGLFK